MRERAGIFVGEIGDAGELPVREMPFGIRSRHIYGGLRGAT
jgi:hypothetical protein